MGQGALASWDEALYAAVAKDMHRSGDWLNLTLGGSPWIDKPPLAIWFTTFFYKLFGVNEFSARLFSALCGIGAVLATYFIGRALFSRRVVLLGALVLLSSSVFFRFARFGVMDAPLTFFFSLALYFFWLGRRQNRYLIFSGIAIGLAVMTKGFAAFFIFPVIWIYCVWAGETEILKRPSYWAGLLVAALIALPWHIYSVLADPNGFMRDVFTKHLFLRTTKAIEGHSGRIDFYLRILINKYHPWIIPGIVSAPYFIFKAFKERGREFVFIAAWMLVIFVSATFIQTKLSWYIFPLYPALSLTVGYFLSYLFREDRVFWAKIIFVAVMILHIPYSHIFQHDYCHQMRGIAADVKRFVPQDKTVYLYNFHESPAAYFYLERKNAYLDDKAAFLSAAKNSPDFYCLIHDKDLAGFREELSGLGLQTSASFKDFHLICK